MNQSKPIELQNTKQIDIIVEEVYHINYASGARFVIYSDNVRYSFPNNETLFAGYSNNELNELISVGDQLSIIYYERNSLFGNDNMVVGAQTETKTYRSLEEYNKGKKEFVITGMIIFVIMEILLLGALSIYIWVHWNSLRQIYCKLKHKK